ncbi:MAG: ATP-binding protein [Hyphomonadaceae bacterium]
MFDLPKIVGDDDARRAWMSVGAPILGLVCVITILAVAAFANFARQQDHAFASTSERLVASAVDGRASSLEGLVLDYANWDAAFDNITASFDHDWLVDNFYSGVADGMIVFHSDGGVRFSWFGDAVAADASAYEQAAMGAAAATPNLQRLVRAASPAGTVARTFARANGRLVLVALAPISQEDDAERLAPESGNGEDFLVMIDVISDDELAAMAHALNLDGLQFAPPSEASHSRAVINEQLAQPGGGPVGVLEWRHAFPGTAAFQRQIGYVVAGLLLIGILTFVVAGRLVAGQIAASASAQAALEASREKSEFLARVSHELRTPLNAIIGYAEIIQEEHEEPALQRDTARIVQAARHLGHLINDIIDQSRIDAGAVKINAEVIAASAMMSEVEALMRPAARAAGVDLQAAASAASGYVYADHVRLRQCLLNIVGNAIKFSTQGGAVTVRVRPAVGPNGDVIVFDVTDSGIGIAENEVENIFRPFTQANSSIAKTFGGTGLGLSITRDLAREMGGDVSVVSKPGNGSVFSLAIPAATGEALQAA